MEVGLREGDYCVSKLARGYMVGIIELYYGMCGSVWTDKCRTLTCNDAGEARDIHP